jgi:hypothetical protein
LVGFLISWSQYSIGGLNTAKIMTNPNNSITTATFATGDSPFDSIRRFDADGNEFWTGRELMEMFGYSTWQKFDVSIGRAIQACDNTNGDSANHFLPLTNPISAKQDYRLSRYGCYLIAMNGDPSKPAIAAAQSYFAVKTREAEVMTPAISEALELARINQNIRDLDLQIMAKADLMSQIHGQEFTMVAMGRAGQMVQIETLVTEVVQPTIGKTDQILTADQLKRAVKDRTGQKLKSMADFTAMLRKAGRDDLLLAVTRHYTSEYISPDKLNEAIDIVYGRERQGLIKPVGAMVKK